MYGNYVSDFLTVSNSRSSWNTQNVYSSTGNNWEYKFSYLLNSNFQIIIYLKANDVFYFLPNFNLAPSIFFTCNLKKSYKLYMLQGIL